MGAGIVIDALGHFVVLICGLVMVVTLIAAIWMI